MPLHMTPSFAEKWRLTIGCGAILCGCIPAGDTDDGVVTRSVAYLYETLQKRGSSCKFRCSHPAICMYMTLRLGNPNNGTREVESAFAC